MSEQTAAPRVPPGQGRRRGFWARIVHRLTAEDSELDAESLATGADTEGAKQSCFCRRGELTTVAGRLREVVYVPGAVLNRLYERRRIVPTHNDDIQITDGLGVRKCHRHTRGWRLRSGSLSMILFWDTIRPTGKPHFVN